MEKCGRLIAVEHRLFGPGEVQDPEDRLRRCMEKATEIGAATVLWWPYYDGNPSKAVAAAAALVPGLALEILDEDPLGWYVAVVPRTPVDLAGR